mgnify:FL=1
MKPFLILACLTALLGCQTGNQRVSQLYGGPDGMAALRAPDQVRAWRTTAEYAVKEGTVTQGKLGDYLILNGPVPVEAQIGADIAAILQKDIYEWNMAKGCEPIPGVAVEYTKGANKVLIFFCFECDILLTYLNGNRVSGEDFDRAHGSLAALVKKIFPNDPDIQKL